MLIFTLAGKFDSNYLQTDAKNMMQKLYINIAILCSDNACPYQISTFDACLMLMHAHIPCMPTFTLAGPLTHLCRPVRSKFAVRETASLGIMGAPRVPPLNPSESIVLSEHYRL